MTDRLSSAKIYYFLAMRDAILESDEQFFDSDEAHRRLLLKYQGIITTNRIKSKIFFRICLEDFAKNGWVESIDDEFAPLFIKKTSALLTAPASDRAFERLLSKCESLGSVKNAWLGSALVRVLDTLNLDELNSMLANIQATESDEQVEAFERGDGWSPIPLDRNDSKQTEVLETLEKTIDELRGDNGYTATHPEEKAFVQDKLSAVAKRLREDSQISWMYLREFALKPLGIIIKRFGGAAVGVAAATAKDSLISWLKSRGISFFDDVIK